MNAQCRPQFEGQIVKFKSPAGVTCLDIAKRNDKYGWLEWWAVPHEHPKFDEMIKQATWSN